MKDLGRQEQVHTVTEHSRIFSSVVSHSDRTKLVHVYIIASFSFLVSYPCSSFYYLLAKSHKITSLAIHPTVTHPVCLLQGDLHEDIAVPTCHPSQNTSGLPCPHCSLPCIGQVRGASRHYFQKCPSPLVSGHGPALPGHSSVPEHSWP